MMREMMRIRLSKFLCGFAIVRRDKRSSNRGLANVAQSYTVAQHFGENWHVFFFM
jgi:hypothetical protein